MKPTSCCYERQMLPQQGLWAGFSRKRHWKNMHMGLSMVCNICFYNKYCLDLQQIMSRPEDQGFSILLTSTSYSSNSRPSTVASRGVWIRYLLKQPSAEQQALQYQVEKKTLRKILSLQFKAHKSALYYLFRQMKNRRPLTVLKFKLTLFWQAS